MIAEPAPKVINFSSSISCKAMPCLLLAVLCIYMQPTQSHAGLGLWSDIALGRFIKAEKVAEKAIVSKKDETAANLAPLCLARSRLKRYNTLFSCTDKLDQRIAAGDSIVSGFLIPSSDIKPLPDMLRAIAWLELNKIQQSADSAERALAAVSDKTGSTWGPLPPKGYRVELLTTLGIAYALLGKEEKAKQYLKSLAELNLSDTQPQKFENIRSVGLARIHMTLGEYELALKNMEREHVQWVRGLSDLVVGAGNDSVGTIFDLPKLLIIGKAQAALGRNREARNSLDALIAHPRIVDQGDINWIALFERGHLADRIGNPEEAIEFYLRSIDVFEQQRASLTTEASKIGFVGDKQKVYALLVKRLMGFGRHDEAFAYAERAKARALVDLLANKQKFGGGDAMNASEQNQLLAQLDTAEAKARVVGTVGELSTTRSIVIKNRENLIQQAPELSSLVTVEAPDVKEIQSLLPQGETLIEYYGSGDDLFVFVVTADGIRGVKLDGKGLAADVTAFREAILNPKGSAYQQSGDRLYRRLIAPVASGIDTKNLTIVPHGALHYLPFSALTSNGGFLIDQYNLRILPSASVMKFLKQNQNKAGSLLALGNPDLGDAKYDLPFAQKEAIKVSNGIAGSKLLLRGDASETAVKSYGNSFRYLHFASHGTFDAGKPLNSGLLLAKDAQNDGMLTVGELYDLNLNADLVTLSACETALGKVANGDDVVGFTRGFLYAGASSIVSSLWQVDDAATSDLMTGFYANLSKTDKRSALRNAQLSTKSKYHHPYYWAAFQITGAVQ